MREAAFSLKGYNFPEVRMNLEGIISGQNHFNIDVIPEGEFSAKNKSFLLRFVFKAFLDTEVENPCVNIKCVGLFEFKDVKSILDIPSYFYANSIAILFPYVRAFVSTVTLQANFQPIVLPTMNLSDLSEVLKTHVVVVD